MRCSLTHGVDLRCNTTVLALEGDAQGRLRRAHLSDGDALEVDVAVVALAASPDSRGDHCLAGSGRRRLEPGADAIHLGRQATGTAAASTRTTPCTRRLRRLH